MRSAEGEGRIVGLYVLNPARESSAETMGLHQLNPPDGYPCELFWWGSKGEDYAAGAPPVVVKVRTDVNREELAYYLRELAEAVASGFCTSVDADRDVLPTEAR